MYNQIPFNREHAEARFGEVLNNLGLNADKREWMAEMAEYHFINENVATANLANVLGMGPVVSPITATIPGYTGYTGVTGAFGNGGITGSGDLGQNLLPVAMKIAAQTIGLDLVAVKPSPGPVIDLLYLDFRYDDGQAQSGIYQPMYFKISHAVSSVNNNLAIQLRAWMTAAGVTETLGGLTARLFLGIAEGGANAGAGAAPTVEPTSKVKLLEFLGFSRIDGTPMFRAFRTSNSAAQGSSNFWSDTANNTFTASETISTVLGQATAGTAGLFFSGSAGLGFGFGAGTTGTLSINLISTMEDHLPGFVAAGDTLNPMSRQADDVTYPGIVAPDLSTKRVQIGTVEITTALKRTDIEDVKANAGIDIISKAESVLVDQLAQTISQQIVKKIYILGEENRKSVPGYNAATPTLPTARYDFNPLSLAGGEQSLSLQTRLLMKVRQASGYIAQEGRIGPATFIVTSSNLAGVLMQASNYMMSPVDNKKVGAGQLYPMGVIDGMTVYVNPYARADDNRIVLGRKNNADQPGLIFVPYLMAQQVQVVSEQLKGGIRTFLRSRYAVVEMGYFPQKQYLTLLAFDTNNLYS